MAMRPSLIVLDDYTRSSEHLADWSRLVQPPHELSLRVLTRPVPPSELVETLKPYTMIHAMRERTILTRETLAQLPNLKFITTTALKNRGIDLEACRDFGIVVSGTESRGNGASGTVEQTWALILSLSRRIVTEDADVRGGGWQTGLAVGLHGKQIGLIGLGRLGTQVAHVARAFGMRVVAWSPNLTRERAQDAGVELAQSLDELLTTSDVVSLHIVLSERTRGLLGKKELALLKPTAFLINTSRGPLVDENALIEVLQSRRIAGAGLDVFDVEPLPEDHALRVLDNVVRSPHMGYVEESQYGDWMEQTVANVEAFLAGTPVRLL
ncbi:D-2-hydroxyacid dehydrogenase family protein [Sporobolomyces koalae]|uniref:D-2-hydroxyacid dehydrogenase family protein n=1 Tax=Sporobolomyces koalae TaxID=500713 RepID=UPI00317F2228